jgi:hypothetical protein
MTVRRWQIAGALLGLGLGLTACSSTPANDFEAGECTNDDLTGSVSEIDTVDCDDEHTAEAFAQFDLDDGDFPGVDEVNEQATEGCQGDRFEEYVGTDYDSSIYIASSINPSEDSWDSGDRTVICVISGSTEGALDGSAEGDDTQLGG